MWMLSLTLMEWKDGAEKFVGGSRGGWIKEGVVGRYILGDCDQ